MMPVPDANVSGDPKGYPEINFHQKVKPFFGSLMMSGMV